MIGEYHWCNEHASHPTGPGVTTPRASRQLANAIQLASPTYLEKLEGLVQSGVISKLEARLALLELAR